MDKDTVDILTRLNAEQSKQFQTIIETKEERDNLKFKGIAKNIDSGFEAIKIEMQRRNDIVGKVKNRLDDVEDDTSWWRFFQRNPKKTVFTLTVLIIGFVVLMGFDIDPEKLSQIIQKVKFW